MKIINTKMIVSLAGLLLVAPFLAIALFVGARAVALSQGAQDDLLLVALAICGAAASIVNSMGCRTTKEKHATGKDVEVTSTAQRRGASMIHLGY